MSERKPTKISETRKIVSMVISNLLTYKEGLKHLEQFAREVSPNATESSITQVGARYRRMLKLNRAANLIEFPHRGRKVKEAQPSKRNKRGKLTDVPHLDILVDKSITAAKPARGRPRKDARRKEDTLNETKEDTLNGTKQDTLNGTKQDTLNGTKQDTLNETKQDSVYKEDTLNETKQDMPNETIPDTLLPETTTDMPAIPIKSQGPTEQTLATNFIADAHNYPSDLNQTNDVLRAEFNRIARPIWMRPSAKKKTTVPLVAPDRFNLNHPIWKYKAFTGAFTGMIDLTPELQPELQTKTFPVDPPYLSLYDMHPLYYTKDPFVELIERQKKEQLNLSCNVCDMCINVTQ
jgi:vacuolar-type H+-ATPase subunit H